MTTRNQRNTSARATLDQLASVARLRMTHADPAIRGLRPAETEWLTEDELEQRQRAELVLVETEDTTEEIRERVRVKRAARVAAMKAAG